MSFASRAVCAGEASFRPRSGVYRDVGGWSPFRRGRDRPPGRPGSGEHPYPVLGAAGRRGVHRGRV